MAFELAGDRIRALETGPSITGPIQDTPTRGHLPDLRRRGSSSRRGCVTARVPAAGATGAQRRRGWLHPLPPAPGLTVVGRASSLRRPQVPLSSSTGPSSRSDRRHRNMLLEGEIGRWSRPTAWPCLRPAAAAGTGRPGPSPADRRVRTRSGRYAEEGDRVAARPTTVGRYALVIGPLLLLAFILPLWYACNRPPSRGRRMKK